MSGEVLPVAAMREVSKCGGITLGSTKDVVDGVDAGLISGAISTGAEDL